MDTLGACCSVRIGTTTGERCGSVVPGASSPLPARKDVGDTGSAFQVGAGADRRWDATPTASDLRRSPARHSVADSASLVSSQRTATVHEAIASIAFARATRWCPVSGWGRVPMRRTQKNGPRADRFPGYCQRRATHGANGQPMVIAPHHHPSRYLCVHERPVEAERDDACTEAARRWSWRRSPRRCTHPARCRRPA